MFKLVVLCALIAVAVAKPWPPAVFSPTVYTSVPVVQGGYYPHIVSPVVHSTPIVYSTSPYIHAIKKRSTDSQKETEHPVQKRAVPYIFSPSYVTPYTIGNPYLTPVNTIAYPSLYSVGNYHYATPIITPVVKK